MSMAARRKARILLCQALYQWQMTQDDPALIKHQFIQNNMGKNFEEKYFSNSFLAITHQVGRLDSLLSPLLIDNTIDELTAVELAVLRIGAYEITQQVDIPISVSITEAVRLSKRFGATDGYKFVNAVLDRVAKHLDSHGS